MDEGIDRQVNGQIDKQIDRYIVILIDRYMNVQIDEWIDRLIDRQKNGQINIWIQNRYIQIDRYLQGARNVNTLTPSSDYSYQLQNICTYICIDRYMDRQKLDRQIFTRSKKS